LLPEEKAEALALLEKRELLLEQAELRDLASFARGAWPILEPGTPLKWNWHLDLICEYLTLVKQRIIRRLVINVPPQTMKSRLVNVFYPTWSWSQIPTRRFLSSSYSGDLSEGFNVERSKLVTSEWFQRMFSGQVALTQETQAQIENAVGGRMSATSTGGTATGKGTHDVIVDDPLNPKQAASETELRGSTEFFDQTLRTRLSDQVSGAFVIVMQRLAELDLTGHLMAKNPGEWTHIRMPMEAEEDESWAFPISGRVVQRKKGELLWPDRFPRQVVDSLKRDMGSWAYAAQYQQRPTPLEGGIIKRSWLQFYRELPAGLDQQIQSWDLAFKDSASSSFVVGQVWGRKRADMFLLDEVRARMDFPTTVNAIRSLSAKWPNTHTKLVEDKANGPAVIASLKHEITGLIPVKADISKEARLSAASPAFEAGNVYLPDPTICSWIHDWIQEVCAAPRAAFWDRADACSQAINRLRSFPSGLTAFYQAQAKPAEEVAA
jgi:predicted phage terminase large subunit-like protein